MLDSLTQKELEDYIQNRKLNNKAKELLELMSQRKSQTHLVKTFQSVNGDFNDIICKYVEIGKAQIIAFILECFYEEKYKIKDIKSYMKAMISSNKQLKEYVYELMKDF
jgi:septum formation topological specificity factor MinE